MKTVVSISGGGMRGVIPAELLRIITQDLGKSFVHEWTNLVCGTSTGGILACLAGLGSSPEDMIRFYYESGARIFKISLMRDIATGKGALAPRYSLDPLRRELSARMGDAQMRRAKTRVMVTTMTDRAKPEMIKSWDEEWADLPLSLAALMTSCAQTYFPACRIVHGEQKVGYLDGGNVRNNPSVCALVEALLLWKDEQIRILHIGTGFTKRANPLPNGGALSWAPAIFSALTDSDDAYDDYQCRSMARLYPDRIRYHRIDVPLTAFPRLDDASRATLDDLRYRAVNQWSRQSQDVCDFLS